MDTELEFINVGKTFVHDHETVTVLKNITAKVRKSAIVTIIGPSGSGKSTILSLCNLLATPDEGELYIREKEVRNWDIQQLRRTVGIAFQSMPLLKGTVLDNLSLPAQLQGKVLSDPENYLAYVGLSGDLLTREAKELSGGQKQRLALARTMVNEPSVLLLDEVTSALDSIAAREVEELILRINREHGTTVLWVTHDLAQAERACGQTWLVMDGSLIEAADTKRFFTNPQEERTKQFLSLKRDSR